MRQHSIFCINVIGASRLIRVMYLSWTLELPVQLIAIINQSHCNPQLDLYAPAYKA